MADAKPGKDDRREREKARNEMSRVVQYFGLLIGAISFFNLLYYWEYGSKLTLGIGIVGVVALVAWLAYSRRVLREL